ncbi:MAG TPA: GNAT family N-acetyltransferase [Ardenticatenaceae bacterium]|nr:GNAT family N-acetyltransferase [Ardenticatenaceae bacterium]
MRTLDPDEPLPQELLADFAERTGQAPDVRAPGAREVERLLLEEGGRAVAALVYRRPREPRDPALILFFHALTEEAGRRLLEKALPTLMRSADRIITTIPLAHPAWDLTQWGFDRLERLTMERDLASFSAPPPLLPDGYLAAALVPAHVPDLVLPARSANAGTIDNQLMPASREDVEQMLAAFASGEVAGVPVDRSGSLTMLFVGTPVGVILAQRPSRQTGFLKDIFVAPEHQGQGLGRALIVLALHAFKADGAARVEVETGPSLAAYHLLRRLGFKALAERPLYFWLRDTE